MFTQKLRLFLCVWLGTILSLASVDLAQAQTTGATVAFDTSQVSIQAGQPVSIPLVLNTSGQAIDGLQVEWQLEGVEVTNVQLIMTEGIPLNPLKNEATATGGSLGLIPQDPFTPFASEQPVTIATLTFTPTTEGTLTINYNAENTLIASHETSQNVAVPPAAQQVQVAQGVPGTPIAGESANTSPVESQDLPVQMIALAGAAVLIIVFLVVILMKMLKGRGGSTPAPTPASVMPSSTLGVAPPTVTVEPTAPPRTTIATPPSADPSAITKPEPPVPA